VARDRGRRMELKPPAEKKLRVFSSFAPEGQRSIAAELFEKTCTGVRHRT